MLNRLVIIVGLLLMLPIFANAATYWAITATTSPTSFKSNLTAARPANFGNYTTPGGVTKTLTNVIRGETKDTPQFSWKAALVFWVSVVDSIGIPAYQ